MRPGPLLATVLTLAFGAACTNEPNPGPDPAAFEDLLEDPVAFDGHSIELRSGYLSSSDRSVLTRGFAESFPPQAIDPTIWVDAAPTGACVEEAEDVTWALGVIARGTFRFDADGGYGHLSNWTMALEGATLSCP